MHSSTRLQLALNWGDACMRYGFSLVNCHDLTASSYDRFSWLFGGIGYSCPFYCIVLSIIIHPANMIRDGETDALSQRPSRCDVMVLSTTALGCSIDESSALHIVRVAAPLPLQFSHGLTFCVLPLSRSSKLHAEDCYYIDRERFSRRPTFAPCGGRG